MKLMAPDYYPKFRCIADRCRHCCCIGWEIDIDPETREKYRRVPGTFGKRLNDGISDAQEGAHFLLSENERCPMLNKNNLCDLITMLGEHMLCQICADHPRFRNFFSGRTEIGLGFCCEAAVDIALGQTSAVQFVILEEGKETLSEEETELIEIRARLLSIVQNRTLPLEVRLEKVLEEIRFFLPSRSWKTVYEQLERLDETWNDCLSLLAGKDLSSPFPIPKHLQIPLEQFAAYLLWRHMPSALEDGDVQGHAAFCVLSVRLIASLCAANENCTLTDCMNFVRMYSSEIEYSQENLDALLDALWNE